MARPSKFKSEYNDLMHAYFEVAPFEEIYERKTIRNGEFCTKMIRKPNNLPTFSKFSLLIGVSRDTLYEWAKPENSDKYLGFSDTYKRAKGLQKDILIQNGLLGLYNSTFAIFTAKAITDMR